MLQLNYRSLVESCTDKQFHQALFTHSVVLNERGVAPHISADALAIIGDKFIALWLAQYCAKKGFEKSKIGALISTAGKNDVFAQIANEINVCVTVQRSAPKLEGKALATYLEALVGAIFLTNNSDFNATTLVIDEILQYLVRETPTPSNGADGNHKGQLQEWCQKNGRQNPVYDCSFRGPDHMRVYSCTVTIPGTSHSGTFVGQTSDHTKKVAEQLAAKHCLIVMK
jgi:dsRNA-specific ribonuclease